MGSVRPPAKVKLIVGLLAGDEAVFAAARAALERYYGSVDFESGIFDFIHTDYYRDEMGEGLKRMFLGFKKLLDPAVAYKVKPRTNRIEAAFSKNGKRAVNIDPGYLNLSRVVLFSTKDYSHRIYIRDGIFAECTLCYRDKDFNPWPWTYPDYKTRPYRDAFVSLRDIYKTNSTGAAVG